jgi:pyruvate/2-oxoglutarate dehydrogenase complex dihydrolipoamide dehydrogenase (E3) component
LRETRPTTHIEALDRQQQPEHLIVIGGGYVGLGSARLCAD